MYPNAKLRHRLVRQAATVHDCLQRAIDAASCDNLHPVDFAYLLAQLDQAQTRLEMMKDQARQNAQLQESLEILEGNEG